MSLSFREETNMGGERYKHQTQNLRVEERMPKHSVIQINHIIMQYFLKITINTKTSMMNKIFFKKHRISIIDSF